MVVDGGHPEGSAWDERRNKACRKVLWHVTTADARIKRQASVSGWKPSPIPTHEDAVYRSGATGEPSACLPSWHDVVFYAVPCGFSPIHGCVGDDAIVNAQGWEGWCGTLDVARLVGTLPVGGIGLAVGGAHHVEHHVAAFLVRDLAGDAPIGVVGSDDARNVAFERGRNLERKDSFAIGVAPLFDNVLFHARIHLPLVVAAGCGTRGKFLLRDSLFGREEVVQVVVPLGRSDRLNPELHALCNVIRQGIADFSHEQAGKAFGVEEDGFFALSVQPLENLDQRRAGKTGVSGSALDEVEAQGLFLIGRQGGAFVRLLPALALETEGPTEVQNLPVAEDDPRGVARVHHLDNRVAAQTFVAESVRQVVAPVEGQIARLFVAMGILFADGEVAGRTTDREQVQAVIGNHEVAATCIALIAGDDRTRAVLVEQVLGGCRSLRRR
jgi:hypothetical protein